MDNNQKVSYTSIIEVKKFIIHQITSSKDMCIKYKVRVDFLNNYQSENYVRMIVGRTKRRKEDLHKLATEFIVNINSWIYSKLSNMSASELVEIVNEPTSLDKFLKKLKKVIGENDKDDIFLQKCS
nr:MAG TPA: hypothetical protein [Caudoviricetes sp.]